MKKENAKVDAITTMDGGEGPWIEGTHLQSPHVLIAGKNAVATDAVATAVMGFDPTAEYPNTPFLRGENHLRDCFLTHHKEHTKSTKV